MKKITFFIHGIYKMGGTERVVGMIANELIKKYEVEIISLHKDSDKPFYSLNKNIKIIDILGKELQPVKLYYPYLRYKTKKALKDYHTDVFICAGMGDVGLTSFMRKKTKYITWEHFTALQGKVGGIMWLGRVLSKKYANKIIVLTKKDVELNHEKFKTDYEKLVQIYNPIEPHINHDDTYNIHSKRIISAGRFTNEKGFDLLVEVAVKVFKKHPDWEWHIYGDGEEFQRINELILEKKLQNNLKLMGRTNKLYSLYKDYSFCVVTSRFEGFGMVIIEAHSSKLPVISFNCNCGPDELIIDGVNGYLIDCFNIDRMAEKINYLIEHEDVRKKMSEKTYVDKEKLQIENIIKEWEKFL